MIIDKHNVTRLTLIYEALIYISAIKYMPDVQMSEHLTLYRHYLRKIDENELTLFPSDKDNHFSS